MKDENGETESGVATRDTGSTRGEAKGGGNRLLGGNQAEGAGTEGI